MPMTKQRMHDMMTEFAILTAHCMALVASGNTIEARCIPVIEQKLYQLVVQAAEEINECVWHATSGEIAREHRYCLTKRGKK